MGVRAAKDSSYDHGMVEIPLSAGPGFENGSILEEAFPSRPVVSDAKSRSCGCTHLVISHNPEKCTIMMICHVLRP